jgi:hypothetical protein
MRHNWVRFGSACLCGLVVGCSGTDDVPIGEEGSGINVSRCFGDETRCGRPSAPRAVDPEPQAECVPAERTPLALQFNHNLETTFCLTLMGCQFQMSRLAAAPDGSAWVLGHLREGDYRQKYILSHFAADGTLLGSTDVKWTSDRYTSLTAELAVDAEGLAHVVSYSVRAVDADSELQQRVVIDTFDASLLRVADPITFLGASETLIEAAGGKLALAGDKGVINRGGWIGVLDESRRLLWNQTRVNSGGHAGVTALTFAADGNATVLMDRGSGGGATTRFGLSRFGATGNTLWDLNLTTEFESGYQGALAQDESGNVVVGLFLIPPAFPAQPTLLESFDGAGQLRWAMTVEASRGGLAPLIATEGGTNRVLIATKDGILAIASDAASCHAYTAGELGSAQAMALGADRDVYAITQRELLRFTGLLP